MKHTSEAPKPDQDSPSSDSSDAPKKKFGRFGTLKEWLTGDFTERSQRQKTNPDWMKKLSVRRVLMQGMKLDAKKNKQPRKQNAKNEQKKRNLTVSNSPPRSASDAPLSLRKLRHASRLLRMPELNKSAASLKMEKTVQSAERCSYSCSKLDSRSMILSAYWISVYSKESYSFSNCSVSVKALIRREGRC